jgi:predicted DNA-binding transcriptional regulator AlpA
MTTERKPTGIEPIPELQLLTRERLRITLRPEMTRPSFNNWLQRSTANLGFPLPIRVGRRAAAWRLSEVRAWIEGRERGGAFLGRRSGQAA